MGKLKSKILYKINGLISIFLGISEMFNHYFELQNIKQAKSSTNQSIIIAILQCEQILRNLSKSKNYLIKIITKAKNDIKDGVNSWQSNMYIGNELKCYKIRLITQGAHQFMTS